jgi:hypothetical protein
VGVPKKILTIEIDVRLDAEVDELSLMLPEALTGHR